MNRTAESIIERVRARVNDRIEYTVTTQADGLYITHEPTNITMILLAKRWAEPSNSDASVARWIGQAVDYWLADVGKVLRERREVDENLAGLPVAQ